MRVRITRRLNGSIDGIQLRHFDPGVIYEVGTVVASYLLANGDAVPVPDDTPLRLGVIGTPRPPRGTAEAVGDRKKVPASPRTLRQPDPESV